MCERLLLVPTQKFGLVGFLLKKSQIGNTQHLYHIYFVIYKCISFFYQIVIGTITEVGLPLFLVLLGLVLA